MNAKGKVEAEVNVVPLFGNFAQELINDPLADLIEEAGTHMEEVELQPVMQERRKIVREDQFPDQGIYILDQQLKALKESVARMKFYLGDLDDLIPK